MASRRRSFQERLDCCGDPVERWRVAKELLHSSGRDLTRTEAECATLASSFSDFFTSKIHAVKLTISARLASFPLYLHFPDPCHSSSMLDTLPNVSVSEVLNILQAIPPKLSPLDFIPTCLIKSSSSVFSDIIAHLSNLSIRQGVFLPNSKLRKELHFSKRLVYQKSFLVTIVQFQI